MNEIHLATVIMNDWLAATSVERVGVVGLLLLLVFLLTRGILLTRRTADKEQAAMREGYEAKDEAHAEVLAYKNEQIAALQQQVHDQKAILDRRDRQLAVVLDEMAPSLIAWADATDRATMEVVEGGGGHGLVDS